MDKKPDSFKASSMESSELSNIEAVEVKECTEQNLVADDVHKMQTNVEVITDTPKKLNSSSIKTPRSANHTAPKPSPLLADKLSSSLSGNAASHNSSSASTGSQPYSPLPARKTTDHEKLYEEDTFSVASSSATSVRTIKPKITVGVAPTFRSTTRLERRKEFYQKLEEKQKALEEEKRENERRLKEEQELVTKQLRKSMTYKANPVPNFYYEAPPPKLPLKKFPLTRPKSPNFNHRKSCSDTVNSSYQEVKGKQYVRHRNSVDGCKDEAKESTSNMRKSPKSKSEEVHIKNPKP